ncbi:E3 ubiquitin-protein ligase ATL23-like [Ananas comosus]|uniref:E3 ubiquitin-protein ligase ATL23-like n=1 Tax=Ananas comosus TaxID=4615 RepID=A0A6P5F0L6_ANACO|nr:E3 ubiquitin-protein ligase ATL23-like [Ananas comosus]
MLYRYPALRTSQTSIADGSCICCGIAIVFLSVFLFCVFLTFLPFRWASVATAVAAVLFICTACWCRLAPDDSAGTSHHRGRTTPTAVVPQDALHPPATAACLQTFEYEKALRTSGRAGGSCEMCAVCIGVLQGGEMVRQVPACKHVFHIGCIDAWLYSHTTCPLCRAEIKPRRSAEKAEESEESSAPPLPPV